MAFVDAVPEYRRPSSTPPRGAGGLPRGALAAVIAVSGLSNALSLAGALFVFQIYDRVLTTRSGFTLVFLAVIFAGMLVMAGVLDVLRARILIRIGNGLEYGLIGSARERLFSRDSAGDAQPDGREHLLEDLQTIRSTLGTPVGSVIFDALWVPIFFIALFLVHPIVGMTSLACAGLLLLVLWMSQRAAAHLRQSVQTIESGERALLASVGGILAYLWATGREAAAGHLWTRRRTADLVTLTDAVDLANALTILSRTVRAVVQILVLGAAAWLAIHGEVSVGAIFASSILAGRALAPTELLASQWGALREALAALRRIGQRMRSPADPAPSDSTEAPESIELNHAFGTSTVRGSPTLRDVSLSLRAGEILGVMGPAGCGKTTLLRLTIGLTPAVAGTVRVNGHDPWAGGRFRHSVGYMPQEPSFIEGTIGDNIASFQQGASRSRLLEAATRAGMADTLKRLGAGLDTRIGADGSPLSHAERRMLALARSVFGQPLLLALDMPETYLGPDGESAISEVINGTAARGGMVLIASHSPRLLRHATRIALLSEGVILRMLHPGELLMALREDRRARSA